MSDNTLIFLIISSVGIMITLALGIILFFNIAQKRIQSEALKNQELKISFQKELLQRTVQTQEKERNRIARELHDDIGSKLNVIHLNLHSLKNYLVKGKDISELLEDIEVSLRDSIETSRNISHELVPPTLRKFGIQSAIEDLEGSINRTGLVNLSVKNITAWEMKDDMSQLHLYRIIQELVQNALKHAKAENLVLSFEQKEGALTMIYTDDGIGFPKNIERKGLGLSNLETRVQVLKGDWHINHEVKKGTEISMKIPLI